jgi:ribonuclease G
VAYEIFREIRRIESSADQQRIFVGAHPTVAELLQDEERHGVEVLERDCSAKIIVTPDSQLHLEQYDLVVF